MTSSNSETACAARADRELEASIMEFSDAESGEPA